MRRTALQEAAGTPHAERVSAPLGLAERLLAEARGAPSSAVAPLQQRTPAQRCGDAALDLASDGGACAPAALHNARRTSDDFDDERHRAAALVVVAAARGACGEQRRCDALADEGALLWTLHPRENSSRRSAIPAAWWQRPRHPGHGCAASLVSYRFCVAATLGLLAVVCALFAARAQSGPGTGPGPPLPLSAVAVNASLTVAGYQQDTFLTPQRVSFILGLTAFFNASTQSFAYMSCVNVGTSPPACSTTRGGATCSYWMKPGCSCSSRSATMTGR
jgi:hypothetical protein